jgi:hypothetical protein
MLAANGVILLIDDGVRAGRMSVRKKGSILVGRALPAAVMATISPEESYKFLSKLEAVISSILLSLQCFLFPRKPVYHTFLLLSGNPGSKGQIDKPLEIISL